jgi:hypothetical protein
MRTAVITQLKTITSLSNRVYQAFTAPENCATPYCTVKLTEDDPSVNNKKGSFLGMQIFIYCSPSTFSTIDDLTKEVRAKLDGITLTIDDSPARYFTPELVRIQADFFDDIKKLFSKRMDFMIPQYWV